MSDRGAGVDGSGAHRPGLVSLPLVVLTLGLVSVVLILASDQLRFRSLASSDLRLEMIGEIKTRLTSSHLWLEEYVTGDRVNVQRVYDDLDWSLAAVATLLGRGGEGTLALGLPTSATALRGQADILEARLQAFRRLTAERHSGFDNDLDVGIGSAIDVDYDSLFGEALATAERLRVELTRVRRAQAIRAHRIFLGIVLGWSLVVITAAVGLWRRERLQRAAEQELAASRRHLLQTQKMDAVGRLAGGLAHDVNNYLAAIRGHCELVRMKGAREPEQTLRRMDLVLGIIDKTAALLDRLLTFSRGRAAQREVVDLSALLREMEGMLGPSVGEAIELRLELARGPVAAEVDPTQIEQAVLNLLVNARDAMPEGGTVRLQTTMTWALVEGHRQRYACLAVEDTGNGIEPGVLDRIWEPFFSSKEGGGHAGLGLSVVYGVVTGNGGRVEVDSLLGRGTRFRLLFPATSKVPRERPPMPREDLPGGHESILLVDDNEAFRASTQSLLEGLGYRVTTAADAKEALRCCESRQGRFDLLLTDLVMPGMRGDELQEEVAARWQLKSLLITGHVGEEEIHREDHLRKLQPARELAQRVRQTIDGPAPTGGSPPDDD